MRKYIGRFRVFAPIDLRTGKSTANEDDTYLLATKVKAEVYRYSDNEIAIYFTTGVSGTNKILPQLFNLGIDYRLFIDGEYEKVYIVDEKHINELHKIMVFQTKGKNIRPESVKTARKLWN